MAKKKFPPVVPMRTEYWGQCPLRYELAGKLFPPNQRIVFLPEPHRASVPFDNCDNCGTRVGQEHPAETRQRQRIDALYIDEGGEG